jgi:hypothetical protein
MEFEPVDKGECDRCAGRRAIKRMCEQCLDEFKLELELESELMHGTDREGRRWIDKAPDDPSVN